MRLFVSCLAFVLSLLWDDCSGGGCSFKFDAKFGQCWGYCPANDGTWCYTGELACSANSQCSTTTVCGYPSPQTGWFGDRAACQPISDKGCVNSCKTPVTPPTPPPSDPFYLNGVQSGKCATVHGGGSENGAVVDIWDCLLQHNNQIWRTVSNGAGYFQLVATNSGSCATVHGGGSVDNTIVDQWQCLAGHQNQLWTAHYDDKPGAIIVGMESGKCLTVNKALSDDGTLVNIYTCVAGAQNQRWKTVSPDLLAAQQAIWSG